MRQLTTKVLQTDIRKNASRRLSNNDKNKQVL
jgi:hypothetical protein